LGDVFILLAGVFATTMGAIILGGALVGVLLREESGFLPAAVAAIVIVACLAAVIGEHAREKLSVTPAELVVSDPRHFRDNPHYVSRYQIESVFVTYGVPRLGRVQEYEIRIWSRSGGLTRVYVSSHGVPGPAELERKLRRMILPAEQREGTE
jgi:hypothetical protein